MIRISLTCLLLVAAVFLASGCGPAPEPVWSYDSQSFFYARTDGAVLQYDLRQQTTRTLLPASSVRPQNVGLSPHGLQLAIPEGASGSKSHAAALNLYSLLEQKTVTRLLDVWGDNDNPRQIGPSCCYWCPSGKRILIGYAGTPPSTPDKNSAAFVGHFVVYDLAEETLTELTTAPPALVLAQALHVSPLCPDGSGYLAMKLAPEGPRFFYTSWDGWEQPLQMTSAVQAAIGAWGTRRISETERLALTYPLPQGTWQGRKLLCPTRKGMVCFDPDRKEVRFDPLPDDLQSEFAEIDAADAEDAPWKTLQVVRFRSGPYAVHARGAFGEEGFPVEIELVDTRSGRRRQLRSGSIGINLTVPHLFLSPDGNHVLVRLQDEERIGLHVVANNGQVIADLDGGAVEGENP
ncbi:hypothetical protein SH661x_002904 [Planctomicrobium sp. SH661]|uniref:hypothetical protein n=1 Tax=Planctomicrobium sp. SH661 TaxID=3448124 RepID=UPI003F5C206E